MCWAATGNGGAGRALNDEDSLNLDGMLSYSQQPNGDSVGFQSLGRGAVSAKCMPRKAGPLLGKPLEPRWISGTLLEPCWNIADTLLEPAGNW